jgi:AcrR family transcriptional regulator
VAPWFASTRPALSWWRFGRRKRVFAAVGERRPRSDRKAAFGSKEQLFFEAVGLYMETVGKRPSDALESAPTARAGVEALLRELVDIYGDPSLPRGCLMYLGAINCTPSNAAVQDRMRAYRVLAPCIIRKRLERGVADGDVPAGVDLEPLVALCTALVHGLPLRARDGATRAELRSAVTAAMASWDHLIRPGRKRRRSRVARKTGASRG